MHAVLVLCGDGQLLARGFDRGDAARAYFSEVSGAVLSTTAVRIENEVRELRFGWLVEVDGADSPETAAAAARAGQGAILASTIEPDGTGGRSG